MFNPSYPSSTFIPRETIRPGAGARRLPHFSKCIPKDINFTPTTSKHRNAPGITQMVPQEHLTWDHEYPPKDHVPHPKITHLDNSTPHCTDLDRHPVPNQY